MSGLISFGISFFIAYFLIPYLKKLGIETNILAYPNERSIHEKPIPTMGGMSFFISFLFSFFLFGNTTLLRPFLLGSIIIFIVGLIDDSTDLRPIVKLCGQILGVGVFFFFLATSDSLQINYQNIFFYIFLSFFILGTINAINLTDGLDGLAGGVFLIDASIFLYLLFTSKELTLLILTLMGGVTAFLLFNFYPAYIFMGDTGSNFLGFSLGVLSFYSVKLHSFFPGIIYAFLILSLPILDTGFAILRRMKEKKAIFSADKLHIHHILLNMGMSQSRVVLLIWLVNATAIIPVMLIKEKLPKILIFQILTGLVYYLFLIWGIIYLYKINFKIKKVVGE